VYFDLGCLLHILFSYFTQAVRACFATANSRRCTLRAQRKFPKLNSVLEVRVSHNETFFVIIKDMPRGSPILKKGVHNDASNELGDVSMHEPKHARNASQLQ